MADYIKREDAVKALWKALYDYEDKTEKQFQESEDLELEDWYSHRIFVQRMSGEDLQAIINLPSADVVERKRGKMKLKPCPFCGKMPKIDTSQWKHNEMIDAPMELVEQRVKIDCDECFLHMDIRAVCYADLYLGEKVYRALAKRRARDVIVNVWNRRAEND